MNEEEMTMRTDERPTLVQRWVIVRDDRGEHLEARWVVEGETQAPTTRPSTHAA
jgi:hypothetical protein